MEPINNLLGSCWSFVSLQPRDIEILFGAESVQFRVSESCGGPCWLVGAMLAVPSLEQLEPPHGTVGNSNCNTKRVEERCSSMGSGPGCEASPSRLLDDLCCDAWTTGMRP